MIYTKSVMHLINSNICIVSLHCVCYTSFSLYLYDCVEKIKISAVTSLTVLFLTRFEASCWGVMNLISFFFLKADTMSKVWIQLRKH